MRSIPEKERLGPEFDMEENLLTDDVNSKSDYQSEIEGALLGDEYRLGEVYRLKCAGMDTRSIANKLDLGQGKVRDHLWTCRVLIERRGSQTVGEAVPHIPDRQSEGVDDLCEQQRRLV